MITFTHEELRALREWLKALGFQGTREQIKKPLALYDCIVMKLDAAIAEEPEAIKRVSPRGNGAAVKSEE